jgi:hypothetical protein
LAERIVNRTGAKSDAVDDVPRQHDHEPIDASERRRFHSESPPPDSGRAGRPGGKQRQEPGKEELERQKLELEIAEAKSDQASRPEKQRNEQDKERLELRKLEHDLQHRELMDGLEARKSALEIKEKQLTTRVPTSLMTVIPILATLVGLYLTYRKDTEAFRHQVELEQKFKVDKQVGDLIKEVGGTNRIAANDAAMVLSIYGRPAIRFIVPDLKLHTGAPVSVLIGSLRDIVENEPADSGKESAADETARRIGDEINLAIRYLLLVPTDATRSASVEVYLNALEQLYEPCATACAALHAALKKQSQRISEELKKLDGAKGLDKDFIASVDRVKLVLGSVQGAQSGRKLQ